MRSNILLILCFAGHVAFAAPAPFKSKEEVDFLSKKNNEQVSLVKTDDFQGLVTRPDEKNSDLQNAEYYQFKSVDQSKVSQKLCEVWLERIFGPLKEITLKV
ncbi:MAG: hypothetical protein H7326_02620, partial [Bdellovibrionaceae bacterium]|nr:hypothetical protein [Pseudobdellovibrionaceae bacterium]